ncbi:MAG TPA: carbon-nitrogen hydrolase family protein [Gemmatimonadaceae bacterium]|jgi:predicted amidohydrolase
MTIRVAIAQAEAGPSLEEGLHRTDVLAGEAADRGAQLVVFPETWIPGYPAWLDVCRDVALWDHAPVKEVYARYADGSVDVSGPAGLVLREIAARHGLTLVTGVSERVSAGPGRGTLYNALLVIGPDGRLLNHHRKLVPTYTERMVWGNGDAEGLRAVDTPIGRLGGLICWEHWMPLARQALHDSGEDVHIALWPMVHERLQLASRHYAFEGRCFVLAAGSVLRAVSLPAGLAVDPARVPAASALVLRGGSAIIGPDGNYVAPPVLDEAKLLVADLDLAAVRREQMSLDVAGHYSRPDCLELSIRTAGRREVADRVAPAPAAT